MGFGRVHGDYRRPYFRSIGYGESRRGVVDPPAGRGLHSGVVQAEYPVPSKIVKTRFRRIAPSVETGPSTCGAGRADSAHRADITKLVRPAF
jgi:hypothetical protein